MLVTICAYIIVMILMYHVTARVCHVIIELEGERESAPAACKCVPASRYPLPSK